MKFLDEFRIVSNSDRRIDYFDTRKFVATPVDSVMRFHLWTESIIQSLLIFFGRTVRHPVRLRQSYGRSKSAHGGNFWRIEFAGYSMELKRWSIGRRISFAEIPEKSSVNG